MAKTKKTTKTSRKTAPKTKKTASPKKRATLKNTAKKTVKKKSTKKKSARQMPAKTTNAKNKATSTQPDSAASHKTGKDADTPVTDRRAGLRGDRRDPPDRRIEIKPVTVGRRKLQRREKVNRRRQIDPTTCERDYTAEEVEFMQALDEYKRKSGRMFPTCSEILEVICDIGYSKQPATTPQTADQDLPPPVPPAETSDESLATLA